MRLRSRLSRWGRWASTVGAAVTCILYVASVWATVGYVTANGTVHMLPGGVGFNHLHPESRVFGEVGFQAAIDHDREWSWSWRFDYFDWGLELNGLRLTGFTLFVPLWMPLLAFLIPAAVLWWPIVRRGRFGPGRCKRCGYDRAGIAGDAPCPECGASG